MPPNHSRICRIFIRILVANASALWLLETCASDNWNMQIYMFVTSVWWLRQGSNNWFLRFLLLWVITWWNRALEVWNLVANVPTWWGIPGPKISHVALITSDACARVINVPIIASLCYSSYGWEFAQYFAQA